MTWFIFALLAAIITALSAVVEKKTLLKEHAMEFSAVLAIFNLIILLPFIGKINFKLEAINWAMIIFVSLLSSIAFLFFAKALRHSEVSVSSALMNFRPALVFLLALIFLKETLTIYQVAGVALLVTGAYILEMKHKNEKFLEPFKAMAKSRYAHYIFLSIALYSVSSIFDKIILESVDVMTYLFLAHLFIALFFIAFIFIFHDGIDGIIHGAKSAGKWIIIIAMLTVGYRFLQTKAVAIGSISLVSTIKQSSALFATLIGGTFFHEKNLAHKILAAIIMMSGVILLIY